MSAWLTIGTLARHGITQKCALMGNPFITMSQILLNETEITTIEELQKFLSRFEPGTKIEDPFGGPILVFELFNKQTGKITLSFE